MYCEGYRVKQNNTRYNKMVYGKFQKNSLAWESVLKHTPNS